MNLERTFFGRNDADVGVAVPISDECTGGEFAGGEEGELVTGKGWMLEEGWHRE